MSSLACTPASHRARLDPTPLHHSTPPPVIVLSRSPTLSVSRNSLRLFTFPLSPFLLFRLAFSPARALVLVIYTFSPYDCLGNSLSLHLIGASSHALPHVQPSAAHIRASWGGVVHHAVRPACPLPSLFLSPSPPNPPARLLVLRHPSSSRGYSASQHRRRRENRYYGEINMIGRRMPRYPYT